MSNYRFIPSEGVPIRAWVNGVNLEEQAKEQLQNIAKLPIIHSHIAVMPDVHLGKGATIGSVIPTLKAIIPNAVGVDLGCGMTAVLTTLFAKDLPDNLLDVRTAIEKAVPHGRSHNGKAVNDTGAWNEIPSRVADLWKIHLDSQFKKMVDKYPEIGQCNSIVHLGTLGTGNHFIELCLDENQQVWIMLHSGSRGVGNRIASTFISKAKKDMENHITHLPDKELAYLEEGSPFFEDYIEGITWAQEFASINRQIMMERTISALKTVLPDFETEALAVNCHHNYVSKEHHFGEDVFLTRKGAVSAKAGELGIIPGSMGAKSFIVRGKGNPDSFQSCSHGAGRVMSRTAAKKMYTVEDQIKATEGVECRKDESVIDEIPMAYKNIDDVMAAQSDLVDIVHTLKQVVCVKG